MKELKRTNRVLNVQVWETSSNEFIMPTKDGIIICKKEDITPYIQKQINETFKTNEDGEKKI